ncbi:helix-turn-helix domain-containing protein [Nocardia sp. NPDC050697]|uniref:helix-turn-helix domain-containing protein n=1 Tax=Nocardia sp. NPDC050697 TaxID=3155158 RepID=UPI0033CA795F
MNRDIAVWLTTDDVSRRLKIPRKTLANWAASGKGLRYVRIGRYRRYRLTDLVAWEQGLIARGGGEASDGCNPS